MHIEHTHRRLAKTRGSAAGPLHGFALAVYDVERDLIGCGRAWCDGPWAAGQLSPTLLIAA
jgi:hypothetical protein